MIRIQLALDFIDLDRALKIARECEKHVDIMEVGTPLIKSEGLEAVRALRRAFPKKTLMADMKVMDAARVEVESAARAGADIVGVCGQASDATVKEAVESARLTGCKISLDLISTPDPVKRAIFARDSGISQIAVHTPIDEQMSGHTPFDNVCRVRDAVDIEVAAAGGINSKTAPIAAKAGADIIIVGGAITKAKDPSLAAKKISHAAKTLKPAETPHFTRTRDISQALSKVSSSNVSDAMHRRGELDGIRPLGKAKKVAGPAYTVLTCPGDWAKPVEAIDSAKKGDIIVISCAGKGPAVWGELATDSAMRKGISAVIVDGAVRDSDRIRELGFPVYSRLVTPTAGEPNGIGQMNLPIKISGVEICPGDWVVADGDGVVIIPSARAVDISNRANDVFEKENRIRCEIAQGGSLASVTHLLKWEKSF